MDRVAPGFQGREWTMRRLAPVFILAFAAGCSLADKSPEAQHRKAIDEGNQRIAEIDAKLAEIQKGREALAAEPDSDEKVAKLADLEGQEKTLREARASEEAIVKQHESDLAAATEAAAKEAADKEAAEKEAAAKEAAEKEAAEKEAAAKAAAEGDAAKSAAEKEAAAKDAAEKEAAEKEAAAKAAAEKESAEKEAAAKAAAEKEAAEKEAAAKAAKPEPPAAEPPKPTEPPKAEAPKPAPTAKEGSKPPDAGGFQLFEEKHAELILEIRSALLKR
jgi:hypothetical protein